jgi:hypothetical protein
MNRDDLQRDLKKVGVTLKGWMPVLQCDVCKHHWEPFSVAVGSNAPTVRFDYWQCKNRCNANAQPSHDLQVALPRYVVLNDIPGMLFGDGDLAEFKEYVCSMDATQITNRSI